MYDKIQGFKNGNVEVSIMSDYGVVGPRIIFSVNIKCEYGKEVLYGLSFNYLTFEIENFYSASSMPHQLTFNVDKGPALTDEVKNSILAIKDHLLNVDSSLSRYMAGHKHLENTTLLEKKDDAPTYDAKPQDDLPEIQAILPLFNQYRLKSQIEIFNQAEEQLRNELEELAKIKQAMMKLLEVSTSFSTPKEGALGEFDSLIHEIVTQTSSSEYGHSSIIGGNSDNDCGGGNSPTSATLLMEKPLA